MAEVHEQKAQGDTLNPDLKIAQELANSEDWDRAYLITDRYLQENPNAVDWLMLMVYIMLGTGKPVIAYSLAKRCLDLSPKDPCMYLNFGMAANELWKPKEAERMYRKGIRISKSPEQLSKFLINLTGVYIDNGRFDEAKALCLEAIELNQETVKGYANLGFCQMAMGEWLEGWKNYRQCIGTEWRPKTQYANEPEWDGVGRGNIVLYAEQGLGDMICFASMIPDMQKWCDENDSTLIVDIDVRLHSLFERSFHGTVFYPTAGSADLHWKTEHHKVDYSLPMGQIGEYFRTKESDFPKTAYLTPDIDREYMWRSLFKSKKKPAIGIAWTGGVPKTGAHLKRLKLEQLLPLFESIDAHWVSLQYRSAGREIDKFKALHDVDLVEYPHATLVKEYDATAAMVSALDAVVCVPTSVAHLGGALGVRTITMAGPAKCWKYNAGIPFHPCTIIDHSTDWKTTIKKTASNLEDLCESSSVTTQDSPLPITSVNTRSSKMPQSLSA